MRNKILCYIFTRCVHWSCDRGVVSWSEYTVGDMSIFHSIVLRFDFLHVKSCISHTQSGGVHRPLLLSARCTLSHRYRHQLLLSAITRYKRWVNMMYMQYVIAILSRAKLLNHLSSTTVQRRVENQKDHHSFISSFMHDAKSSCVSHIVYSLLLFFEIKCPYQMQMPSSFHVQPPAA